MLRFFKYFFITFSLISTVLAIPIAILYEIKAALIVSPVFGALFGLFVAGHLERNMKRETLIINSNNKDPNKGLNFYLEEIKEYLFVMRYQQDQIFTQENYVTFSPRPRLKIMGGNVTIKKDPYEIEVEAPVGVIRILESQLDLKKIFL